MLDQLSNQIAAYLKACRTGLLSVATDNRSWVMPVRYQSTGLKVECLLPRWADLSYYIEQATQAMFIVQADCLDTGRWLQYQAVPHPVASPDWSVWQLPQTTFVKEDELYCVVELIPTRIDLIDESQGWGARQTLEL